MNTKAQYLHPNIDMFKIWIILRITITKELKGLMGDCATNSNATSLDLNKDQSCFAGVLYQKVHSGVKIFGLWMLGNQLMWLFLRVERPAMWEANGWKDKSSMDVSWATVYGVRNARFWTSFLFLLYLWASKFQLIMLKNFLYVKPFCLIYCFFSSIYQ